MSGEEQQPPECKYEVHDWSKLPKHMRLRYWTSWEELRLMELWRRYNTEVVSLQKNAPVFRKIAECMKEYGFYVNGQECRRKISSLKNKYIAERRRLETGSEATVSQWRLYPIIHCLLLPKQKNADLLHEINIVDQLIGKLPAQPVPTSTHLEPMNPMETGVHMPNRSEMPRQKMPIVVAPVQGFSSNPAAPQISQKRAYIWRTPQQHNLVSDVAKPTDGVQYLLRQHFTASNLEQIRIDNLRLAERRDNAQKRLHIEEQEYKMLQSLLVQWQNKQQQVLQRLQCAGGQ